MSEHNKQVLTAANAAITQGDFDGFLKHCTEDTKWIFIGDRTLQGKDAVRRWMVETYKEPPRFDVKRMVADDEFVAAMGEITVKDAAGKATRNEYCDVWRFKDGMLHELRAYVVEIDS